MLAIYRVSFGFIWYLTSDQCRKYMFSMFMIWFREKLIFDQWLIQALCVSYLTKWFLCKFGYSQVIKAENLCWLICTMHFWFHLVNDQWWKQILCVIYFNELILCAFFIGSWFMVHLIIVHWIYIFFKCNNLVLF